MTEVKSDHRKKSQFTMPSFIDVDEVYVSYVDGSKTYSKVQAAYLSEDRYLSALNGINPIKQPSFKDSQIYYSLIDGKMTLLPEATQTSYYKEIKVLYIEDFAAFTMNTDVPITREYKDLYITLAAIEAMIDTAREDKVALMREEANDNFKLLGAYSADRKNREGVQE